MKNVFSKFYMVLAAMCAILVGITIYNIFSTNLSAQRKSLYRRNHERRMTQVKNVLSGSKLFSETHDGRMPTALSDLSAYMSTTGKDPENQTDSKAKSLLDRLSKEVEIMSPSVLEGYPNTIFIQERDLDELGRRIVGYADGSVISHLLTPSATPHASANASSVSGQTGYR